MIIYWLWPWITGACEITLLQSINVGTKVMVAVTLSSLPGSSTSYLMAVGGLDSQVHLYVGGVTGQVPILLSFPFFDLGFEYFKTLLLRFTMNSQTWYFMFAVV